MISGPRPSPGLLLTCTIYASLIAVHLCQNDSLNDGLTSSETRLTRQVEPELPLLHPGLGTEEPGAKILQGNPWLERLAAISPEARLRRQVGSEFPLLQPGLRPGPRPGVGVPQGIPWLGVPGAGLTVGGVGEYPIGMGGYQGGFGGYQGSWGSQGGWGEPGGDFDLFKVEYELAKKAIFSVVAPLAALALLKPKLLGVFSGLKHNAGGAGSVPLAVLSSNTGRRRRSLWTEEDGEVSARLFRMLETAQQQDLQQDLLQDQATAEYIKCSGYLDSFCLERMACELQAQHVARPQRDVGQLIMESLLGNGSVPGSLKRRLKKAWASGRRGQDCARYWCHKLDQLTSRSSQRKTVNNRGIQKGSFRSEKLYID